jgi:hypothetical protein
MAVPGEIPTSPPMIVLVPPKVMADPPWTAKFLHTLSEEESHVSGAAVGSSSA